ncbi:hypothetical protein [Halomonas alkalisoli]|nr:hypothetical protein [Halomonas alkalisoli]
MKNQMQNRYAHDVACIGKRLIEKADQLLYLAKQNGRDQIVAD